MIKGTAWLWCRWGSLLFSLNSLACHTFGPFYSQGLTLIPAWISNHLPVKSIIYLTLYWGCHYLSMLVTFFFADPDILYIWIENGPRELYFSSFYLPMLAFWKTSFNTKCFLHIYISIDFELTEFFLNEYNTMDPGTLFCMCPANERWRYFVKSTLIGREHAQNDPWPPNDILINMVEAGFPDQHSSTFWSKQHFLWL